MMFRKFKSSKRKLYMIMMYKICNILNTRNLTNIKPDVYLGVSSVASFITTDEQLQ